MKSTTMQSWAVVLVMFSATMVLGQECNPEMFQECNLLASPSTEPFPSTKEHLKKMCTDFTNLLDCFKSHLKNCAEDIKHKYDGLGIMPKELCDESSPVAKGFLQHGGCLRDNNPEMLRCTESKAKTAPSAICSNVLQCVDEAFSKKCGADAARLAKWNHAVILQPLCPDEVKDYISPPSSANFLKHSVNPVFMSIAAILWLRRWG